jgi:hypothetical protein
MFPIVYTTYGLAMGHPAETLANSGGLRPAGAEPVRTRPAHVGRALAPAWLHGAVGLVCRWPRDRDARTAHGSPRDFPTGRSLWFPWVRRST